MDIILLPILISGVIALLLFIGILAGVGLLSNKRTRPHARAVLMYSAIPAAGSLAGSWIWTFLFMVGRVDRYLPEVVAIGGFYVAAALGICAGILVARSLTRRVRPTAAALTEDRR
jgi:hypothetical protein